MDWPRLEVLAAARASSSVSQCRSLSRINRYRSGISCWSRKSRLSRSGGRRVVAKMAAVAWSAIPLFGILGLSSIGRRSPPRSRRRGQFQPARCRLSANGRSSRSTVSKNATSVPTWWSSRPAISPWLTRTETGRDIDESRQHSVMIAKPFAVASSISCLRSGMRALPNAVAMSTYRRIKVGGAVGGQ
jgi:hypothetical protein